MAWLTGGVIVVWMLVGMIGMGQKIEWVDHRILDWISEQRTAGATRVALDVQQLGAAPVVFTLRWAVIVVALVFRRFRHLLVFIGAVLVSTWVTAEIATLFQRPRPLGVEILGPWHGFSHPSRPLADMAVAMVGLIYVAIPRGRRRDAAKFVTGGTLLVLAIARLYLAIENPSDALFGVIIGMAISLVSFRYFVPEGIFPIVYKRRGRAAHLDVGGRRGEAIVTALREQLGLDVAEVKPFGLDGSAGSTPLRIRLADPKEPPLFGKLYAKNHLRADRSYKLFRTLVYGRLEDESTFSTVRRLIQYEDYLLRLMHGAGIPTARPLGFVEITPEREYLLVTEFIDGAQEIGDAEVTDAVIDDALALVRRLWEAGLAHRDIKPANLLVRDNRVFVIDVAFAEVRPSPWRQAVDLANMMLVLALRSDPEQVYRRALLVFAPDEIGEAFAATRGITLTSQLRARLRQDGRDLVGRFRDLAPVCRPVRIQIWSLRRIALTLSVLVGVIVALRATVDAFTGASLL